MDLVDPHTGAVLCPLHPLDKTANASAQRRRLDAADTPQPTSRDGATLPPLLHKLLAEYAATGLPPAYLPTHNDPEPEA